MPNQVASYRDKSFFIPIIMPRTANIGLPARRYQPQSDWNNYRPSVTQCSYCLLKLTILQLMLGVGEVGRVGEGAAGWKLPLLCEV